MTGSFFQDQIFPVAVPSEIPKTGNSRDRDVTLWFKPCDQQSFMLLRFLKCPENGIFHKMSIPKLTSLSVGLHYHHLYMQGPQFSPDTPVLFGIFEDISAWPDSQEIEFSGMKEHSVSFLR